MIKKFLTRLFSKTEVFEAFIYVNKYNKPVGPGGMSTHIRWLKDITVTGLTYKQREIEAFELFKKENGLKKGQVCIFGSRIVSQSKNQ